MRLSIGEIHDKTPGSPGVSPENGADDGIRTRDPHLGKVMLYQLSHVRVVEPESTSSAP